MWPTLNQVNIKPLSLTFDFNYIFSLENFRFVKSSLLQQELHYTFARWYNFESVETVSVTSSIIYLESKPLNESVEPKLFQRVLERSSP